MTGSWRRLSKPARRAPTLTHPIFVKLTFSQSGLAVKSTGGGPKIHAWTNADLDDERPCTRRQRELTMSAPDLPLRGRTSML